MKHFISEAYPYPFQGRVVGFYEVGDPDRVLAVIEGRNAPKKEKLVPRGHVTAYRSGADRFARLAALMLEVSDGEIGLNLTLPPIRAHIQAASLYETLKEKGSMQWNEAFPKGPGEMTPEEEQINDFFWNAFELVAEIDGKAITLSDDNREIFLRDQPQ